MYRGTGSNPYPPKLLLAIALFEILNGVSSPAAWHRDATTRLQCVFLGQGIAPSRTVFYDFRDRASKFLDEVHKTMVQAITQEGLCDPKEACLDGTFTAASASRRKLFNLAQVNKRRSLIKRVIAKLDDPSQVCCSRPLDRIPKWIGRTCNGRRRQLEDLNSAKRKLLGEITENRGRAARHQRDENKILVSPADVDAVIGRDKLKVVRPLYNVQYMCAANCDVILAYGVEASCNDHSSLIPMIHTTRSITDGALSIVHADCSYCSVSNLAACEKLGISLFASVQENNGTVERKAMDGSNQIPSKEFAFDEASGEMTCPAGHLMNRRSEVQVPRADGHFVGELRFEQDEGKCRVCPLRGKCLQTDVKRRCVSRLKDQHLLDAQQAKMEGAEGKQSVRLRAEQVERRFADGKQHRNQGVQNGRGKSRVQSEVGLLVVAQNTLTIYNLRERRKQQAA